MDKVPHRVQTRLPWSRILAASEELSLWWCAVACQDGDSPAQEHTQPAVLSFVSSQACTPMITFVMTWCPCVGSFPPQLCATPECHCTALTPVLQTIKVF